MKTPTLFFITLALLLSGCGETNMGKLKNEQLTFDLLPDTIKHIYETEASNKNSGQGYIVVSTDTSFTLHHKHTGMDDGLYVLLTKGFYHHFKINERQFKLQANQGDPFILHDKHFYYTLELNISAYNYKEAKYVSVDLTESLQ